ncbi:eCIS core domain-containing protein [Hyalangium gracile]|uniref:eCIS core domain-containing protein n=1 Tax=Hyalangium gracile TaxID=394092 RepID=UPI001CCD2AF1|nr:DUF4157 domain-containing protein [Hyalangium gracile]
MALPYAEQLQKAFGRHDLRSVRAHVGGTAAESAVEMNAQAYTQGNHVVFAGRPSLHTAAHEAAHVVQQRAGVRLAGGVGAEGDAYERHADAVAERVVAGLSVESLLDPFAGQGPVSGAPVQGMAVQRSRIEFENLSSALGKAVSAHTGSAKKVDSNLLLHGHASEFRFPKSPGGKPEQLASFMVDDWTNRKRVDDLSSTMAQVFNKNEVRQEVDDWGCTGTILDPLLNRFIFEAPPQEDWLSPRQGETFIPLSIRDTLDVTSTPIQRLIMHLVSLRAALKLRETEEAALNVGSVRIVDPADERKKAMEAPSSNKGRKASKQPADEEQGEDVQLNWAALMRACRGVVKTHLLANRAPPREPPSVASSGTIMDALMASCFEAAGGFSTLVAKEILTVDDARGYDLPKRSGQRSRLSDQGKARHIGLALNHVRFILWSEWRAVHELLTATAATTSSAAKDEQPRKDDANKKDDTSKKEDGKGGSSSGKQAAKALTPDGRPSEALKQAYRASIVSSDTYLSQAEGALLATAWGVTARVYTELSRPQGSEKLYVDTVSGDVFRLSEKETAADGNCLIDGLCLLSKNHNASKKEISDARTSVAKDLADEYVEAECASIITEFINGNREGFHQGLGDAVHDLLSRDPAIQSQRDKALRKAQSEKSKRKDSSAKKEVPSAAQPVGKSGKERSSTQHGRPGMGRLSPSVTYGSGVKQGYLMFIQNPGHYVVLEKVAPGNTSSHGVALAGVALAGGLAALAYWMGYL